MKILGIILIIIGPPVLCLSKAHPSGFTSILYLAVDSAHWMDLSQLAFCPARPLRLVPIPVGNSTANHSSVTRGIALS